jgi:hypothetical protein
MLQLCSVHNSRCTKTRFELASISTAASLPTRMMPMASQVGRFSGYCDRVAHACGNLLFASRADVRLQSLVWLNPSSLYFAVQVVPNIACHCYPKNAHATRTTATPIAMPTNQMSLLRATCLRVGLNPISLVSPPQRPSTRTHDD